MRPVGNELVLPHWYGSALRGAVYGFLREAGIDLGRLFHEDSRGSVPLFTVSRLGAEKAEVNDDSLKLYGAVKLTVGLYDSEVLEQLTESAAAGRLPGAVHLRGQTLLVARAESGRVQLKAPVRLQVRTLSPVCAATINGALEVFESKVRRVLGREPCGITLEWSDLTCKAYRVLVYPPAGAGNTKPKRVRVRGYVGRMRFLVLDDEELDLLLSTGLGLHTAYGCGCLMPTRRDAVEWEAFFGQTG